MNQDMINASQKRAVSSPSPYRLSKNPNSLTLFKWYGQETKWATEQIDNIELEFQQTSSCKAGCSACCRQPILITSPEAIVIMHMISNWPMESVKNLYLRLETTSERIKKEVNLIDFNAKYLGQSSNEEFMERYFQANIQCPLLNEEGKCTVYPVRPTNCWTYRVYANPEDCSVTSKVPHGIQFADWESEFLKKMFASKKPRKNVLALLPFALLDELKRL